MRSLRFTVVALLAAGCQSARTTPSTTTSAGPAAQPAATQPSPQQPAATAAGTQAGAPGGQGGAAGPRRRPDPRQLEAGRANVVRQLLTQIAGRENEPAGKVFKNVKLLQNVPAAQFLQLMNEQYGRSLGMNCGGCHVPGQWEKDDRPNKTVARGMQQMVSRLNGEVLPRIPQIDADFEKVNCGTCHKGNGHPVGMLPHPDSAAAAPAGPPAGPPPGR